MNLGPRSASWVLLLASCTIQQGGTDDFAVMTSGMESTTAGPEAGTGSEGGSSSSTSSVDTSGGPASTSSGSTGGSGTTGVETDAGGDCGNGVPDEGEECDDGNDDEFDACTSQCTVPVCDDGERNGTETDVDCGGTCQGCATCQGCDSDEDCDGAMVCGDAGRCVTRHDVVVDWVTHCPGTAQGVTVPALPAGTYRATATLSAGTIWLPPHNPPNTGYFYEAQCNSATFEQMRTPEGIRYINISTAFNALISETETFDHAGGDFTCWRSDDGCDDNDGTVAFTIESACAR